MHGSMRESVRREAAVFAVFIGRLSVGSIWPAAADMFATAGQTLLVRDG